MLRKLELVRISDRVLDSAGVLLPAKLRSFDAIHLATAQLLGEDLGQLITYDDRMIEAARSLGFKITSPVS